MQEYVIDLYRHFLFRFFWAMSKVMYLVILLSFCYLTEDYMVFAYFAVLCNIDKRICSLSSTYKCNFLGADNKQ